MTRQRAAAAAAGFAASTACAHGFGQRYDLPLPLSLYLAGAALIVALSCVMLVVFVRATREPGSYPRVDLLRVPLVRVLVSTPVIALLRLVAVVVFVFLVFAGFLGSQNPFRNIVPLTVWALWWVGVSYVSAGLGDVWRLANPLETIFAAAERAFGRLCGRSLSRDLAPPRWMGMWPVVFLYLAFLWMEVAWEGSDSPASIAALMLGYAGLTWTGMWLYGRETWLERGEVFTRVFGVFARFAPLRFELAERRVAGWELRPYAVGLFEREPQGPSEFALVILILAAVSFDGFLETPAWAAISQALSDDEAARWPRTLGLVAAPILFASVFLLCSRMAAVMCLVPIAIAYLVAHYLSFLATAGQYLVPLVSDPLGLGWNLFGTAQHFVRMGIVDARWVWMIALGVIVAGHVAALYLGHLVAMRESPGRRAAVRSQLPMLALMVGYTMASLWIIAQPIVSNR